MRKTHSENQRHGVILLVVITFLTLFALVGIAFVYYSQAEADASAAYRDAQSVNLATGPNVPPQFLLDEFLRQLIYDVADDATGVYSALRGHSLARSIYGWDSGSPIGNTAAYNGTGRLHTSSGQYWNPFNSDDYLLPNYTFFKSIDTGANACLRDPEHMKNRKNLGGAMGPYIGGFNPPYTYPDLNNMFLAALRADGTVLMPSYHRPYTGFASGNLDLDPNNANWTSGGNDLKYRILRPRPADNQGFPPPVDAGGDVQNLLGNSGYNGGQMDSIWLDIGSSVRTLPNQNQYKPLFAATVLDLDNKINLNVVGNIANWRGPSPNNNAPPTHRSNMGWGITEVNPQWVLSQTDSTGNYEWPRLFGGNGSTWFGADYTVAGRYGSDAKPSPSPNPILPGYTPHIYGQVDFDGCDVSPTYSASAQFTYFTGQSSYPTFPSSFDNGSPNEKIDHPLVYDFFQPGTGDRVFDAFNMNALIRDLSSSADVQTSDLGKLCPVNFVSSPTANRARLLVTTHSFDVDQPGASPWVYDPTTAPYTVPNANPGFFPPQGTAIPYPALASRGNPIPANSDFSPDWRQVNAALGRIDLNQFLPPYPHMGQGVDWTSFSTTPLAPPNTRFDDGGPIQIQFIAAQTARQQLADKIYRALFKATGVAPVVDKTSPTDTELLSRRYLAQLAANIVDFIDEDDIGTPFQFYNTPEDGLLAGHDNDPSTGPSDPIPPASIFKNDPSLPRYWVFGTEMPRVVLNEVLTEYTKPAGVAGGAVPVKVWVELFNPLPNPNPYPANVQQLDSKGVPFYIAAGSGPGKPAYSPIQIVIANYNTNPGGPLLTRKIGANFDNANVIGMPDQVRTKTTDADFSSTVPVISGPPVSTAINPQQYFLIGPGPDSRGTIAAGRVPANTPWLQTSATGDMQYTLQYSPPGTWTFPTAVPPLPGPVQDTTVGISVLLRRLANPYMPYDQVVNPYMTIDFTEGIIPNDTGGNPATNTYASIGKKQPYASDKTTQIVPQTSDATPPSGTKHTLGKIDDGDAGTYDWFCHLDRQVVDPMELLQVSGYQPWQLTHQFINPSGTKFQHRVPWFDEDLTATPQVSHRLFRLFEFLETGSRAAGVKVGRFPGKININTVFDPEPILALTDPPSSGGPFSASDVYNQISPNDLNTIFGQIMQHRSPGVANGGPLGLSDQPFVGLSPAFTLPGDTQSPGGQGLANSFFSPAVETLGLTAVTVTNPLSQTVNVNSKTGVLKGVSWTIATGSFLLVDSGANQELVQVTAVTPTSFTAKFTNTHAANFSISLVAADTPRLFQIASTHPYIQQQLITKILNNVTTRSNVFAVYLTVGFFQVTNSKTLPVKLGTEIGASTGTNIRHHMFAIVDRSALTLTADSSTSTTSQTPVYGAGQYVISVPVLQDPMNNPPKWTIQAGTVLTVDDGTNRETATVLLTDPAAKIFTANFNKPHVPSSGGTYPVYIPKLGNPGPQPQFTSRDNSAVVLYATVID